MMNRRLLPIALPMLLGSAMLTGCTDDPNVVREVSTAEPSPAAATKVTSARVTSLPVKTASNDANAMSPLQMTVYKSPTCGCCTGWVDYMSEEGFAVKSVDTDDVDAIKTEHGLNDGSLKSCHTAIIDGYVIEGHVPSADVKRLLAERPEITGLSAPGMPMMSPGMSSREPKDYDVIAFDEAGKTSVWSSY